MSYNPHQTTRHSILPSSLHTQSTQSTALQTRINAKRAELANLRQLCDLSSQMATQMQALEDKLSTLKDGTEAVACILANWENVMRAISMASTKAGGLGGDVGGGGGVGEEGVRDGGEGKEGELPVTLVRIPVGQGEDGQG